MTQFSIWILLWGKFIFKYIVALVQLIWTIAKRRLRERPRKTGPFKIAGPVPFMIPQCCMQWLGMKGVRANECLFWAANCLCTSCFPSENCRNRGPTRTPPPGGRLWAPTDLRITTNVNLNIKEAHKAAPFLCQSTPPAIFHPGAPELSPSIPMGKGEWTALTDCSKNSQVAQTLIETAAPNNGKPEDIGSGKINLNCAQPTHGQSASPRLPADTNSDVMSAAIFGGSNSDSEYVETTKDSPLRFPNTPDLTGNISKLEMIH